MAANISSNQKYIDKSGLSHFFSILDSSWWNKKYEIVVGDINNLNSSIGQQITNELSNYLPLNAGPNKKIKGGLYIGSSESSTSNIFIHGDILPELDGIYNLGKPETGQGSGDGKVWANIYSNNIITGNLTVTGQLSGELSGNSSSASKTTGGLYLYNTDSSSELFKFDGSTNTHVYAVDGLVFTHIIENNENKSNYYNIGHSNKIAAGTTHNSTGQLDFGSQIHIPKITYDSQGHITESSWTVVTLPSDSDIKQDITELQEQVNKIDNEIGFGNIKIGDTVISADSHQGTLTFETVGNISITADPDTDKIIISTTATTDAAITPENVNMYINNLLLNK